MSIITPDTIDFHFKDMQRVGEESLATSLTNHSLCLIASSRPQAGLQILEEAYKIASDCEYMALAEQIEEIYMMFKMKLNNQFSQLSRLSRQSEIIA